MEAVISGSGGGGFATGEQLFPDKRVFFGAGAGAGIGIMEIYHKWMMMGGVTVIAL